MGAVPERTSQSGEQAEYWMLGGGAGHPNVGGASPAGRATCWPAGAGGGGWGGRALQLPLGTLECSLALSKMSF